MRALNRSPGRLNPSSRSYRVFLPYFILLLGFCFTGLVYHYFSKLTYEQDRIRFDRSVQEVQDQIKLRIATSITLLRAATGRSEEHTSELQSPCNLVCRLLLEK